MIPLPEPHAWQHEDGCSSFITNRTKRSQPPDGKWPSYYSTPLYTADQLRAYGAACAAEERERCAKKLESAAEEYACNAGSKFVTQAGRDTFLNAEGWALRMAESLRAGDGQ